MCNVHEDSSSPDSNYVIPKPLDHSYVSTMCSLSIILMCPLIILRFVILILIWAMRTTCLICLVGMLLILYPNVTLVGMMPPLTHIAYT